YFGVIKNIYKQLIIAVIGSVLCVVILRNLVRGHFGNFITNFICFIYDIDAWEYASSLYYDNVRIYYSAIILIVGILFFLLIFTITLRGFTKCFDAILHGVDALLDDQQTQIQMPKEIAFVGKKLQSVKEELNKRKHEKEEVEKRKDELIVYLAHDINTPLTSVIGYISLLDEYPDMRRDEREKYTRVALDKAIRLEELINEFFEITRSHTQTICLEKSKADLVCLIKQVADETYPMLTDNHKQVEMDLTDQLFVEIDAQKMARVIANLLKNACYYGEDEKIKIYTVAEGDALQIIFENKGNIPEEDLNRLFEKFYRADQARQTKTGGAGLGLAISKDIVEAHGGSIVAECKNELFRIIVTLHLN
ncbi:MAG: HAMP domain-containing histidine kinase, partial [Firmicutes bacterium]|nr:HAMP domain-containing histidine kinase [Bacillota bacterium]